MHNNACRVSFHYAIVTLLHKTRKERIMKTAILSILRSDVVKLVLIGLAFLCVSSMDFHDQFDSIEKCQAKRDPAYNCEAM
jgi:hypothetical protein